MEMGDGEVRFATHIHTHTQDMCHNRHACMHKTFYYFYYILPAASERIKSLKRQQKQNNAG